LPDVESKKLDAVVKSALEIGFSAADDAVVFRDPPAFKVDVEAEPLVTAVDITIGSSEIGNYSTFVVLIHVELSTVVYATER
jgi:hypothetical protein